jgi:hypothetical protein
VSMALHHIEWLGTALRPCPLFLKADNARANKRTAPHVKTRAAVVGSVFAESRGPLRRAKRIPGPAFHAVRQSLRSGWDSNDSSSLSIGRVPADSRVAVSRFGFAIGTA